MAMRRRKLVRTEQMQWRRWNDKRGHRPGLCLRLPDQWVATDRMPQSKACNGMRTRSIWEICEPSTHGPNIHASLAPKGEQSGESDMRNIWPSDDETHPDQVL